MKRFTSLIIGTLALGLLLSAPATAFAFTQRSGESISVDESISDDLYLFGTNIEVSGDVDGDVIAFGQSIRITGDVSGSVISAGQNITVSGTVGGSVRAAGSDVTVDGAVDGDVVAAGNVLRVESGSTVGRDVVVAGARILLDGDVARNVLAAAERVSIAGTVGGDVTADVDTLSITDSGNVQGDVTYYSSTEAQIDGQVGGQTDRRAPRTTQAQEPSPVASFLFGVLGWIRTLVGLAILTVLVLLAARPLAERAAHEAWFGRPLLSVGIGLAIAMTAFPLAALVFFIGLLIGGWWIAFVWLALVWLLALFGVVVAALAIGGWLVTAISHRWVHPIIAALLGVLVLSIVGAVPIIGWLAYLAAVFLGMGALVLAVYSRTPAQPAVTSTPTQETPGDARA